MKKATYFDIEAVPAAEISGYRLQLAIEAWKLPCAEYIMNSTFI